MNKQKFIRFSNETIKKLLNPENPDSVIVKDEGCCIYFVGEKLAIEYVKGNFSSVTIYDELRISDKHEYLIAISIIEGFMSISSSYNDRTKYSPEYPLLKRIINLFEEVKDSDIEIVEI